jgi:hypothetical protein
MSTQLGAAPKPRVRTADRPNEHVSEEHQRSEEAREPEHHEPRTTRQRLRKGANQQRDEFFIPVEEIPPG